MSLRLTVVIASVSGIVKSKYPFIKMKVTASVIILWLLVGILNPIIAQTSDDFFDSAVAKNKTGDFSGAIRDLDKALVLNPKDALALYNRGIAKGCVNDKIGAIKDFDKVIELTPDDADARFCRGLAKHGLQDYRGAIRDYDEAIDLNPRYAIAYYARGVTKIALGDTNAGYQDMKIADDLGEPGANANKKEF